MHMTVFFSLCKVISVKLEYQTCGEACRDPENLNRLASPFYRLQRITPDQEDMSSKPTLDRTWCLVEDPFGQVFYTGDPDMILYVLSGTEWPRISYLWLPCCSSYWAGIFLAETWEYHYLDTEKFRWEGGNEDYRGATENVVGKPHRFILVLIVHQLGGETDGDSVIGNPLIC